jgi:hypothetical protein
MECALCVACLSCYVCCEFVTLPFCTIAGDHLSFVGLWGARLLLLGSGDARRGRALTCQCVWQCGFYSTGPLRWDGMGAVWGAVVLYASLFRIYKIK